MPELSTLVLAIVMCPIPFYRTSNEQENYFLDIEPTQMNSTIGNPTQIPYFLMRTNGHQTLNLVVPITSCTKITY